MDLFAGALIDAVAGFHSVVGAHRDVKPTNVLVRSVDPLVLVVGDVGLSRSLADGPVRWTRLGGSPPYQAPEAALGKVSEAGDWWAAGMIIAEAALGRHPLALEDGSLPDDRVLQTEVAERDIPLEGVRDPRLRLLCEGLLTRDSQVRWGLPQIAQWQAGGSPATGFADEGPERTGPRVRRVRFGGADYDTVTALAAGLAADPNRAAQVLFVDRDPVVYLQVRALLQAHGLSEALSELDGYRSGAWQPGFLRLLAEMDAGLSPQLAGQSMTPDAVARVAQQVIAAGRASAEQVQILQWVIEHDVWRWWWELPGMDDAAQAAERLVTPVRQFPESGELLLVEDAARWAPFSGGGEHVPVLLDRATIDAVWARVEPVNAAWCVVLAAHPGQATEALEVALRQGRQTLGTQDWWQGWAADDSPAEVQVLAVSVIPLADIAARELPVQIAERERQRRQEVRKGAWQRERNELEAEYRRLRPPNRRGSRSLDGDDIGGCLGIGVIVLGFGGAAIGMLFFGTVALLLDLMSIPQEGSGDPAVIGAGIIWGTVALIAGAWFARKALKRLQRRRELERSLTLPPPWEDPGMAWSDSEESWVPKSQ